MKYRNWFYTFVAAGLLMPRLNLALKTGASPSMQAPIAVGFADAFAAGPSICDSLVQSVFQAVPAQGTYLDPVLDHFHGQFYRLNKIETVDIEMIFCRLINVLGFDPDLNNLPQTIVKGDPRGPQISVTVRVPTESFATTLGYVAKAEISQNGTVFLVLWWAGRGSESKGYLIQGSNPMQVDGMKRLRYVMWDRSSETQFVKILGTQFASSYLGSVNGAAGSQSGGDGAHYGRASYNASTLALSGQSVHIRKFAPSDTSFSCIKTMFAGTLGGLVSGFRPANGVPNAVSDSTVDGTNMDGRVNMSDTKTSQNSGTADPQPAALPENFDYSCADLNGAGGAGEPFAGNTVDVTAAPSSVFPN